MNAERCISSQRACQMFIYLHHDSVHSHDTRNERNLRLP